MPRGRKGHVESRPLARQIDLGCEGCQAETKTAVDRVFGSPEIGHWLAVLGAPIEQCSHHRPKDTASPVGRQDPGDGHSCRWHPPAGGRQLKRKSAQTTNSATTLPCGIYALCRQDSGQPLRLVFMRRGTAEVVADRYDRLLYFFHRPAGSNFEVHILTGRSRVNARSGNGGASFSAILEQV